ncbi:MAG: hypothetical protein ACE5HE_12480 [Phycisphaerae bacterium]
MDRRIVQVVERRVAYATDHTQGIGRHFLAAGPLPGGFILTKIRLFIQNPSLVQIAVGFGLSGRPEATLENFNGSMNLLGAGQKFAGTGMTVGILRSRTALVTPYSFPFWVPLGTGSKHVIMSYEAVGSTSNTELILAPVVERWDGLPNDVETRDDGPERENTE